MEISPYWLLATGSTLLVLTVAVVLIGMRKIKLGRKTLVYHKWVGLTVLGLGIVHGFSAVLYVTGLRVG
jgi:hypothetical protein